MCVCVCVNINISKSRGPIAEVLLGRGIAALGFGLDRIRTLVSMAKDSSHRVIMGNML